MANSVTNSNDAQNLRNPDEDDKQLLDSRRKAVDEGRDKILDWDEIKGSLGKRK